MNQPRRGAAALPPALRAVAAGSLSPVVARHAEPMAEVRRRLVAFVDRRVESPEAAEDIVQDVLERLQRARPGTITNVQAWLYAASRHAIIDHYRKRRDTTVVGSPGDLLVAGLDGGPPGDEPHTVVKELARCLRPMVESLPRAYRQALTLVDLEGKTHQAAAQLVGISIPGMKSRVQRGRRKLADALHECCLIETTPAGGIDHYTPRGGSCAC